MRRHSTIFMSTTTYRCACLVCFCIIFAGCTAPTPTPPIQPKVLYTARPNISHTDPPGPHTPIATSDPPRKLTPAEKAVLPLQVATAPLAIALFPPAILVIALAHARP